jgi:hypothetical protein
MPDPKPNAQEPSVEIRRRTLLWSQKLLADALYERQRTLISDWLMKQGRRGDWRSYTAEKFRDIASLLAQDEQFRWYCEGIDQLQWTVMRSGYQDLASPLFPDHVRRGLSHLLAELIETMEHNEQSTPDDFRRGSYAATRLYYQNLSYLINSDLINPSTREVS